MNRLIKFFLTSFYLISVTLSINCFTAEDVKNNGFTSYNGKVYDISNYIHPAGQDTLFLAKGKALEEFFNIPEYSFHITSRFVNKDLQNIYVGNLYQSCGNTIPNNTINNNTHRFQDENSNILNDSPVLYSSISGSVFIFSVISTIIINNTSLYLYFGKILNLYFFFLTRGELLFLLFYLSWWTLLLTLSIIAEDILTNLGVWISLNIAFTLLPMTRNSIWIKLLNSPYNSLMIVHKFIATLTTLSVIIKIIFIAVLYNINFLVNRFNTLMGTISSLSIILTSILTLPLIRKNIFELFYYSHRILCIITIVTMSLHYISSLYYVIPSFILYMVDLLLRMIYINESVYSKIQTYKLAYNTKYIILTLKLKKDIYIKPGSYFFICCKNISSSQWHPISLMNIKNRGLNFCIKDMGEKSWSNKLINYDKNFEDLDIFLQGPYSHFNLNYNYKYILCISNGIGITPFFSVLDDIINNKPDMLKKIIFVWIVPHESFILPFIDIFDNIDTELVVVDIYITKSNGNKILDDKYYTLLNIYDEKPIIKKCIDNFIINNVIINMSEIGIFSCGSSSLTNDLNKTCSKLNIDLFNENFI